MTITINVAKTSGVSYNGMFNSFAGGALSQGNTTSGGYITYTFSLNGGQVIPANASGGVGVQWSGNGSFRVTSGDLWTVTSTSGGINSTISGTFLGGVKQEFNFPIGRSVAVENALCTWGENAIDVGRKAHSLMPQAI